MPSGEFEAMPRITQTAAGQNFAGDFLPLFPMLGVRAKVSLLTAVTRPFLSNCLLYTVDL